MLLSDVSMETISTFPHRILIEALMQLSIVKYSSIESTILLQNVLQKNHQSVQLFLGKTSSSAKERKFICYECLPLSR